MKLTLLTMVQDILSDMGSDKVNSIGDTEESNQVASLIRGTYYEMISRKDWPHLRKAGQLLNVNDSDRPTHMQIPTDSSRIDYLAYSKQQQSTENIIFRRTEYMYPDDFLHYTSSRNTENSNVETVNDGIVFYIFNDTPPKYYTSFDDKNIVFDSYVKDLNTTLTSVNSQLMYYREPVWEAVDTFIPDLPSEAFPMLYAEAKSVCFLDLKQIANQKAEQQATRQNFAMAQRSYAVKGGVRYRNYGRQTKKFSGSRHFNPNQFTGTTP